MISAADQNGRDLTTDERMTWGTCPVCAAGPGQWCHAEVGLHVGRKVDGSSMATGEGVHLARLRQSPTRVRMVGEDR